MAQLSIVIPVHNRAKLVVNTLRSVADQTLRPLTIILVDNASTDDTLEVLQLRKRSVEAPDLKVEVLTQNKPGACAARNAGLAHVSTEWVMFFDSDDLMLPSHAARAMEAIEANPEADIIGWDTLVTYADGSRRTLKFYDSDALYNNLIHSSFATQRFVVRTSLVRSVGGWNVDVMIKNDIELGNRLLLAGAKILRLEGNPTVHVVASAASITTHDEGRICRMSKSTDAIRAALPKEKKHWADLVFLIQASTWAKNDPEAPKVAKQIIAQHKGLRGLLFRALYRYSLLGGRGVGRIYRLLNW